MSGSMDVDGAADFLLLSCSTSAAVLFRETFASKLAVLAKTQSNLLSVSLKMLIKSIFYLLQFIFKISREKKSRIALYAAESGVIQVELFPSRGRGRLFGTACCFLLLP